MDLVDAWPLFGLRLFTPRLELRVARDEDIPGLAEAAIRGIHDPERLPFARAWTDEPPETLRREMARYFWRERAAVAPGTWMLNFAVLEDGVPIGVQDLRAVDFTPLRTVSTGSWLTGHWQCAGSDRDARGGPRVRVRPPGRRGRRVGRARLERRVARASRANWATATTA